MRLSKKNIGWVCRAAALAILLVPVLCFAAPRIPGFYGAVPNLTPPAPAAVPQLKGIVQGVTDVVHDQARNKLTVNQDKAKAIVDWHSFDIGSDAHAHFNQQGNPDWAALNRIYDRNPSQIYGRLTADGEVFLINQNGILFGPGSRVNVRTLAASSLNIKDEDFVKNALNFKAEDYAGHGGSGHLASAVSNHGVIETDDAGLVLLLASTVENSGVISSSIGQVGLIAGSEAELKQDVSGLRPGLVVTVKADPGEATNYEGGFIAADQGIAGMYGRVVNQEGIIRSISALKKGGRIELFAAEKVRTGENSVTACPVSTSSEAAHESFQFNPGVINILGLNPTNPNPIDLGREGVGLVDVIEHAGLLLAPSGTIRLGGKERVYLDKGSAVDVSGAWVDLSGQENQVSVTLNSVQLRDDYGQKEGILMGTDIQVNAREGSAVGDISGSLTAKEKTALEQAAKGGKIEIHAPEGEIILRDRARVSFAGGGVRYGAGDLETTKLLLGRKVHDISEADPWMPYEKILGLHETRHERFGISEEHRGLHHGGANPLRNYVGEHTEGSDGGRLQLSAGRIILDGRLDGSVLKGVFQTMEEDPKDEYGNQTQKGRREPQGGALEIGTGSGGYPQDRILEEIVIQSQVAALPEAFQPSDPIPARPGSPQATYLSAPKLNEAGLGSITLMTNTRLSISDDAHLNLAPGGTFFATSRQIVHDGALTIPSGSVDLRIVHTLTSEVDDAGRPNPRHVPLEERIFFGKGSRISVAGEKIDNSMAGQRQRATQARLDGGSISLKDETHLSLLFTPDPRPQGVFIMPGAVLDVSGGWEIDAKGAVTAGNAGTLHLQGSTVSLAGEIRGHSLPDATGGGLILHANTVLVESEEPEALPHDFRVESPVPEAMTGKLLHDWGGTDHGFTMVEIRSERDIASEPGVVLSPSLMRLAMPIPGHEKGNGSALVNFMWQAGSGNGKGFHPVLPDYAGKTSLVLKAGELFETSQQVKDESATIVLPKGAGLKTAPGGEISLSGPDIYVAGTLEALSGKVTLKSTVSDLHLAESARIMATGYNKPETTSLLRGVTVGHRPMAGGTVTLSATGDLVLKHGSLLDVSGSEPTQRFLKDDSGNPVRFTVASDPGSVNLAYGGAFVQEAEIRARAWMDTLKGGSFSLSRSSLTEPLLINAKDIDAIQAAGFDALTFRSPKGVAFSGNLDVSVPRALTLDAPVVSAEGAERIAIASPWITLANTYTGANSLAQIPASAGGGETALLLGAEWIDLKGSFVLAGFGQVAFEAGQSIRGADLRYQDQRWEGMVKTAGDLTLKAGAVYPATLSDFTFRSAGKITVLPGKKPPMGTPLSAGGGLTLESPLGIEHRGVLAAPMGTVSLKATGPHGRVYLADGSLITTAGKSAVPYGVVDRNVWKYFDKKGGNILMDVEGPPAKAVDISAPEIIAMAGSLMDLSAGGSVFAYQFLPGAEGTENPLTKKGRYVIFPGGEFILPGHAVRLEGGAGVKAGVYSLLPPEYAFLPGALVIQEMPDAMVPGDDRLSETGLPLISGYPTFMGAKGIRSTMPVAYEVRSAVEVLREGHFDTWSFKAGDGGSLRIAGTSTVLDGRVAVAAMQGFRGGVAALSGKEILLGEAGEPLPSAFSFGDALPSTFRDLLRVNPTIFSGMDLDEIRLGELAVTERLTLEAGSLIEASQIALAASKEIILRSGAEIHAFGAEGAGTASLISPEGKVTLEEKALVHASDAVKLETVDLDFRGEIAVDNSAVDLVGAGIFFVPEGYDRTGPGLYLTQTQWDRFSLFEHIGLRSRSDIVFLGDFSLAAAGALTIDAPRFAATPAESGGRNDWTVDVASQRISLLNSGAASSNSSGADTGTITLSASELFIGKGDIRFDGFAKVNLLSASDVTFRGKGSLVTGGADLDITASRVTTSFYSDEKTSYESARFTVDAAAGAVTMRAGAGTPGQDTAPGGLLEISGRTIDLSTLVQVNSGQVRFNASGTGANEGIFLRNGAGILAGGNDYAPGGGVELRAEQGAVSVAAGSTIDVSAGAQGDAGSVSLFAPVGGVSLEGMLLGHGAGARGGSFEMDTDRITDFSSLNALLSPGGFSHVIDLRARTGNVTIGPGQRVESREFRLSVDQGTLSVFGEIDASGPDGGGLVELYAGNLLTLYPEARILSGGMNQGARGGDVFLGTAGGYVAALEGSLIDVSGREGGLGGTVSIRAPRYEAGDVKEVFILPFGTIRGPRDVFVEAFKVYSYSGNKAITNADFGTSKASGWWNETEQYMSGVSAVETRLLSTMIRDGWDEERLHLLPGIEVRSAGDLTLASDWDLTSWRFNNKPGALTLRAGGNLAFNRNLVDHPTSGLWSAPTPDPEGRRDSWALTLAAGADWASAGPRDVRRGVGNLNIAGGTVVYTESAPIRFSSGRNTTLGPGSAGSYMTFESNREIRHNLGTYDGPISGNVGGDLRIIAGAIQSAVGRIDLSVKGDLLLEKANDFGRTTQSLGAVRTTGDSPAAPSGRTDYWLFEKGGDIRLQVEGSLMTVFSNVLGWLDVPDNEWDLFYPINRPANWAASYNGMDSATGIAAMGGGSVEIRTGGNLVAKAGAFGQGDLRVYSGGNLNGRFLNRKGETFLSAMGSFGNPPVPGTPPVHARGVLEIFDTGLLLAAQGDIHLGALVSPTLAYVPSSGTARNRWIPGYTRSTKARVVSAQGDVWLYGDSPYHTPVDARRERLLPPTLQIEAARDIQIRGDSYVLLPSPAGGFLMSAGRDISGGKKGTASYGPKLLLSDYDVSRIYEDGSDPTGKIRELFNSLIHAPIPVHVGNPNPVLIRAGRDIGYLEFYLAKKAKISAGGDIFDIFYQGQNVRSEDTTSIRAGGDIRLTHSGSNTNTGFSHGGPGSLIIQAGGSINLGTTRGVETVGSALNAALGREGSHLLLAAGIARDLSLDKVRGFFNSLRDAGTEFSNLLAQGDQSRAKAAVERARADFIAPLLEHSAGNRGNILMVNSQASTKWGRDDIFLLASGIIDVGRATFMSDDVRKNTGVYTAGGGAINIFAVGDVNVNESRVMTFLGGDITAWSDRGGINAGRGSKTAVSAEPPKLVDRGGGVMEFVFTPPAVGSGIRTLTFDPDGITGPMKEPPAGDVYLFAPEGVIDAGEAGIAGRNVILGATEVLNAQNITFSAGSVGVPVASQGAVGIGALSGMGGLSEMSQMTEQASALASARADAAQAAAKMMEAFVPKWVDVKVIGFE